MITTKEQLKRALEIEKIFYLNKSAKLKNIIMSENAYKIFCYVKALRKFEYYYNNFSNIFNKVMCAFYRRKKNILGRQLGIEMHQNCFDEGLKIWHAGNIVVNPRARIGKNCVLHGDNCIGNNGKDVECPRIGDNVRIGVGAKIIGNIEIANNVTIAAGAVVISSCTQENAVLAGVPAKCVKIAND